MNKHTKRLHTGFTTHWIYYTLGKTHPQNGLKIIVFGGKNDFF